MGIVHHGIPRGRALQIKEERGLRYFVETGTHIGNTALWATGHFEGVYTIEVDAGFYKIAAERLAPTNAKIYHGSSADFLGAILDQLDGPALIWLDAHWSSDLHYARPEVVCPVLQEILRIKSESHQHFVMIDDARLFNGKNGWPMDSEIVALFDDDWITDIRDDVIECRRLEYVRSR